MSPHAALCRYIALVVMNSVLGVQLAIVFNHLQAFRKVKVIFIKKLLKYMNSILIRYFDQALRFSYNWYITSEIDKSIQAYESDIFSKVTKVALRQMTNKTYSLHIPQ